MLDWEPNRANLEWNHAAAEAAIAALRRAADKLDQTTDQRERMAGEARAEWQGRYRQQFDSEHSGMAKRARQLAGEYRDAANRIVRASQAAWEEQRWRDAEVARWEAEKAAEERAQQNG